MSTNNISELLKKKGIGETAVPESSPPPKTKRRFYNTPAPQAIEAAPADPVQNTGQSPNNDRTMTGQSPDNDRTMTGQSPDNDRTMTGQSPDNDRTMTRQSPDNHQTITRQSPDSHRTNHRTNHRTVTGQSPDKNLPINKAMTCELDFSKVPFSAQVTGAGFAFMSLMFEQSKQREDRFYVTPFFKVREVAETLSIKEGTLEKAIYRLVQDGFMIRESTGYARTKRASYLVFNPKVYDAMQMEWRPVPETGQSPDSHRTNHRTNHRTMTSRIDIEQFLNKTNQVKSQDEETKQTSTEQAQAFFAEYNDVVFHSLESFDLHKGTVLAQMHKNKWSIKAVSLADLIERYPGEVENRKSKGFPIKDHLKSFLDFVKIYFASGECPLAHIKTDEDLAREETLRLSAEAAQKNTELMRVQLEALKQEREMAFELYKELTPLSEMHLLCPPTPATKDNPFTYDLALRKRWEEEVWSIQRKKR